MFLRRRTALHGFTLVEIIIVIMVLSLLLGLVVFSYGNWKRHVAETSLHNDIVQAVAGLQSHSNFKNSFPPNLAGIEFAASRGNALTLYTDAPSIGTYDNLSPNQNAQLLLNVCNANLNGINNTACTFAGNGGGAKIHVKGTVGSNTHWLSPVQQSDMKLSCGSACDAALSAMISQFTAQGGTFPAIVSGNSTALPTPTLTPNGEASRFCIEARSGAFPDVIVHATDTQTSATSGACPYDPNLHYYTQ